MAQIQKKGLGAGLGTLIPKSFDSSILLSEDERIQKIDHEQIEPNKDQPRRQFDTLALDELASSIKMHGILQPIVVMKNSDNSYQIIAGERRWRAAKLAKIKKLPAIVRTLKEQQRLEIAIIENVQRVDLSPLEQAASIEKLHQQFGLPYDGIAKQLGKANSTVNNIVRLLRLPATAREALSTKIISEGHARAILAIKDDEPAQQDLLEAIIKNSWSVREAERFVAAHKAGHQPTVVKDRVQTKTPQTEALGKRLQTAVRIKRTAKGGRLEISFTSDDELARIVDQLGS